MSKYSSLLKQLYTIKAQSPSPVVLNEEESKQKSLCEASFYEFVRWSWALIEAVPFVDGWHVQAVCKHLELAYRFEIKSLIINIPPGTMKSTILSMFNAWVWAKKPHLKFLCVSGTKRLAVKDADRSKRIIESPAYQRFWGDKVQFRADSKSKMVFENTAHGHRLSYSMGASVRGEGGNFVIIDDGNTDQEYISDVMRESKNEYVDSSLYLRMRDPAQSCLINVQQRIHQYDITGHMLSKGEPIVHLRLPMEYEADHPCVTVPIEGKFWRDPRTKDGELLWPERINTVAVAKMKVNLRTEYNIAGQLQQRPSPREGGLIKQEWFKLWKYRGRPPMMHVVQSWDTAITVHRDSCYSACTTWGLWQDDNGYPNLMLMDCWRGKLEYPDLKEMIKRCAQDYHCNSLNGPLGDRKPDMILIEKAANGMSLIQDLFRSGLQVTAFDPKNHGFKTGSGFSLDGSKITRAKIASSFIEEGFVWLQMVPPDFKTPYPYARMFLEAVINYPRGDGADIVDSMAQAIIKLSKNLDLIHKGQNAENKVNWKEQAYELSDLMRRQRTGYEKI